MPAGKWLLNELFQLVFYISYPEVTRFEHSVLATKDAGVKGALNDVFTQWIADNVKHNISTLDGKGTFHSIGLSPLAQEKGNKICRYVVR